MTGEAERPQGAILLSSYQQLDRFVRAFADGQLNLPFLLGRPGVQKSRIVQAAVSALVLAVAAFLGLIAFAVRKGGSLPGCCP